MIDATEHFKFRTAKETKIYRMVYLKTMVRLLVNKVYKEQFYCLACLVAAGSSQPRSATDRGPIMHASQQLSQFSGAAKGQQTEQLQREVRAQQVPNNGSSGLARQGISGGVSTWTLMMRIWPLEDRPEEMLVPDVVNGLTFDQLMKYKKHYEQLVKKEGKGEGVFGKDTAIPPKFFEAGEDNCADLLHPAR